MGECSGAWLGISIQMWNRLLELSTFIHFGCSKEGDVGNDVLKGACFFFPMSCWREVWSHVAESHFSSFCSRGAHEDLAMPVYPWQSKVPCCSRWISSEISSLSYLFTVYAARAGRGNIFVKHECLLKHLVWTWICNWLYAHFVQTNQEAFMLLITKAYLFDISFCFL